jgi:hypothetical protein
MEAAGSSQTSDLSTKVEGVTLQKTAIVTLPRGLKFLSSNIHAFQDLLDIDSISENGFFEIAMAVLRCGNIGAPYFAPRFFKALHQLLML